MRKTCVCVHLYSMTKARTKRKVEEPSALTRFIDAVRDSSTRYAIVHGRLLVRSPRRRRQRQCRFRPRARVLYSYVLSWRAYSSARRRSKPSRAEACLYRVSGGCCTEVKFAFLRRVSTPICSASERRVSGRKKRPASGSSISPFFPNFFFLQKKRKFASASFSLFYTPSTEPRVMRREKNSTVSYNQNLQILSLKMTLYKSFNVWALFRIARTLKLITKLFSRYY